jgi:hypothetical protein
MASYNNLDISYGAPVSNKLLKKVYEYGKGLSKHKPGLRESLDYYFKRY